MKDALSENDISYSHIHNVNLIEFFFQTNHWFQYYLNRFIELNETKIKVQCKNR